MIQLYRCLECDASIAINLPSDHNDKPRCIPCNRLMNRGSIADRMGELEGEF